MIKAILFDMYRTLGEDVDHVSFIDLLLAHGLTMQDAQYVQRVADTDAFDGAEHYEFSKDRDQYDSWRREHLLDALQGVGVEHDVAATIVDQYGDWKVGFVKTFRPFPETHSVLQKLSTNDYRVAVCSNWDWDIDHIIDDLGITDVVDSLFSSAQLGVRKPHPAFFERILDKLELTNKEAVFVGDTWETDIVGALGVGMNAVWVDRRSRETPELTQNVTKVDSLWGVLDAISGL